MTMFEFHSANMTPWEKIYKSFCLELLLLTFLTKTSNWDNPLVLPFGYKLWDEVD